MRHLHHQLKGRLIQELRPILAEWSGFEAESLEMTSIYGIRRYTRGSVLRMHVDTTVTHVVSAIVNVDQVAACCCLRLRARSLNAARLGDCWSSGVAET